MIQIAITKLIIQVHHLSYSAFSWVFEYQRHKKIKNDTGFRCFCLVKTEIIYFYEGFRTFCKLTLVTLRFSFILEQE